MQPVQKCRGQKFRLWGVAPAAAGDMAGLAGLEPTTHCLEGSCSVQMSYRPLMLALPEIIPYSGEYVH